MSTDIPARDRRRLGQSLDPTVHVGKAGITEATIEELARHLKKDKLVKVRLLPTATDGGTLVKEQADTLAAATHSELVDVRGNTAVYYRA